MGRLKSIEEKLDKLLLNKSVVCNLQNQVDCKDRMIEKLSNDLAQKDKVISDIIHNIYSQDTSLQFVVMKPYRGKAIVYKDGKRLDSESTTGIDVCIDELGRVEATVRNG